ncbi:LOW QUALITY PROTEIN: epidermal growth factor receptor kinase substrate 8-like protein 3 [Artibeus jamaicensis]|uniref:LOW QUALITY PROTEIN: epidermal growth factor receptor kinase substrate 8-like protein 3 n=1 Tax=Artibeus jamaicensis TaxID=9417 RepID=UPI00235B004E|nr:LOW QUALITY PROTEIN: epidermal growth factor receptor kinase substrate 8-like protein 3 [Artibeus jamaicensis]
MSRPSSKAIYIHRKEYLNTLSSEPTRLQHRVEHLMTCKLGTQGIRDLKDAVKKLQEVDAQGRVWSQNLFLQVRDGQLQLLDIETKEELDSYRLDSIQAVDVVPSSCSYDNILAITVREPGPSGPPGSSTLFFQCQEVGAQRLKTSLQKALEEERESRPPLGALHQGQDRWQGTPQERPLPKEQAPALVQGLPPQQPHWMAKEHYTQPSPRPLSRHSSAQGEPSAIPPPFPKRPPSPQDPMRDQEVLNHVLEDIELFMKWLNEAEANTTLKTKNKLGKKKDKYKGGLTQAQYIDCFQKFKYSFNLLGKLATHLQTPSPDHLLHLLFNTLDSVLTKCPERGLAAQVTSPLLTRKAVDLLQLYLSPPESNLWRSLGVAWTTSRDNWTGKEPPPYQPTFYDGWQIPEPFNLAPSEYQDSTSFQEGSVRSGSTSNWAREETHNHGPQSGDPSLVPFTPRPVEQALRMQVIHEFEARKPKELTVAQGEVVEVLDHSKQWWLVKNKTGESGYIPSNVLEPLESEAPRSQSQSPPWTPALRLSSRPEEVRAWLQAKNFSTFTVKTLGSLTGSQLLRLRPGELQMLCPQEAPQILAQLEAVRRVLEITP